MTYQKLSALMKDPEIMVAVFVMEKSSSSTKYLMKRLSYDMPAREFYLHSFIPFCPSFTSFNDVQW